MLQLALIYIFWDSWIGTVCVSGQPIILVIWTTWQLHVLWQHATYHTHTRHIGRWSTMVVAIIIAFYYNNLHCHVSYSYAKCILYAHAHKTHTASTAPRQCQVARALWSGLEDTTKMHKRMIEACGTCLVDVDLAGGRVCVICTL
jgi:hypothetical protein